MAIPINPQYSGEESLDMEEGVLYNCASYTEWIQGAENEGTGVPKLHP